MGSSVSVSGKISDDCSRHFKAINDTQYILNGKWKVLIIALLGFSKRRYSELQRSLEGIGPKMLSKELRHLELNGLVSRIVSDVKQNAVEYELTEYGKSLKPIMDEMARWGQEHKERIVKEMRKKQVL